MNFDYIIDLYYEYSSVFYTILRSIIWIFFGLIFSVLAKRLTLKLLNINNKLKRGTTLFKIVGKLVKSIVWFIVFLGVLNEFNINIAPIIASAGVLGLAVGFGSQRLVEDFISGFFLVLEENLVIGQYVEIEGFTGTVLDVGLRTTKIKNWRGAVKILNNGDIKSIINYSLDTSLAVVDFSVAYETNINELEPILIDFISKFDKKYDEIVEPAKYLGVVDLAESSVVLRIIATCKTFEHFAIERNIKRDLKDFLESINVEIPFPQMVYTKKVLKNGS